MIYLTFRHCRNLITNEIFHYWVRKLFPSVKFDGTEYGNNYPTIKIPLIEFEENKAKIPISALKNIVKIKGMFTIVEQLSFGVRYFENDLRDDAFFERLKLEYKK